MIKNQIKAKNYNAKNLKSKWATPTKAKIKKQAKKPHSCDLTQQ
jgi:hypothetical protein